MAGLYLAGSVSGSCHTVMADWREQSNLWRHPPVLMWTSSWSLFAFCCAVEAPEWKKSYIYTWRWDCDLPQTDTCIVLVFHMRFVCLRFDIYLDSWYSHNVDLNAQFRYTFTTLCSLSSFTVLFQCPHSDWDFLERYMEHKMCKVVPKQSYPWHVHYSSAGCQWCNMAIIHTFLKFHYFTS